MSIIQKLRDRAAILLTALIALSLIGFLVQDAFIGRSSGLFSGPSKTVGSINGEDIDATAFNEQVRVLEESNRQQGMVSNEMMTQNIIESVWNNLIQETLIRTETEKLGIAFTAKEMSDLLFSENAPQEFKQLFSDPNTGQFDIQAARNWFNNIKKSKSAEEQKMVNKQLIEPLVVRQLAEKYTSLLGMGSYVPKWLVEKMNADNSQFAAVSLVGIPYAVIADSTVKITDDEIKSYAADHKDEFKQEKSRSIAYVEFDATPSSADSLAILNRLTQLKEEFNNTPDARAFVVRNGSSIPYFDGYALKSRLAMANKDLIIGAPNGTVVGPYLDASAYVIAKKLDTRRMPDSVKVRHILISTNDPSTGQAVRTEEAAKKLADSLFTAIKAGSSFAALAATYSEDKGSKNNGGEYQLSSINLGTLAKEFGDFAFYKSKGSREVIKTTFGYHIMEVLDQKNFEEAYKIAYVAKAILASEETDAKASSAATRFAGNSRDYKSFEENVAKENLIKKLADGIKEIDHSVSGLPSRSFVKWTWDNEIGDVSEPVDFKDKYVVAVITGDYEEGVQPPQVARIMAEPIIRNQKKAEILRKKIGAPSTLEAVAAANGQQILNIDTLRFSEAFIPNVGPEAKVMGAAFNKANQSKMSEPIEGQSGLFFVKTSQISALANLGVDVEAQQKAMQGQLRQYSSYGSFEALKKSAKIIDKRREAGF